ncbi:MAG TPA: class I SAM-dependent methyltransferase [Candidatus Didemnitutus sp.]|nr:class I SAM-dependent methyltransferase [Candidatus Didemnitutus sp.]
MDVRESYDQWAENYDSDRNLTRDLDAEATRTVLAGVCLGAALELGCGTGKNTEFYAGMARSLVALDFSPGMIERAREKIDDAHVEFALADLTRRWPVADAARDLVAGNLVLEHIRDLNFIFAEAARVLRPGGAFLVSELHPFRQYQGGVARFQKDGTTREVAAHVHHVSDFMNAALHARLRLEGLREWWHAEDAGKPPRLLTLLFTKPA